MRKTFAQELIRRYRATVPPPDHPVVLEDLRNRVKQGCIQVANKAELEYFGSHSSGFCKPDSDADLSFTWRNYNPWHQGIPKVDESTEKKMNKFSSVIADHGFSEVKYVRARIPVVAFVDNETQISCDVTVGNIGGVENSKILNQIRMIHPELIGMYVNTVKEWGKAREVIAPDRGGFNSFTTTTMSIMVLQELGVVPVFGRPTGMLGELTVEDAKNTIASFTLPQAYRQISDDEQLGEALVFLLQSFAMYYSKFDFQTGSVSLMYPRRLRTVYEQIVKQYMERFERIKREHWESYHTQHPNEPKFDELAFADALMNEKTQRPTHTPFVVEDFVNYVNCGRRVKLPRVRSVMAEFERLHELLGKEETMKYETIFEVTSRHARIHRDADNDPRVTTFKGKN